MSFWKFLIEETKNFFKILGLAIGDTAKMNKDMGKEYRKMNKEGAKAMRDLI